MAQIKTVEDLRRIYPAPGPMSQLKMLDHLDDQGIEFVRTSPFLFMSTANPDGVMEVSPKGDGPGFVEIEDPRTLLIPDRFGNNLILGLTALVANPNIALTFMRPNTAETLRISGTASLHDDPELCQRMAQRNQPAKVVLRVRIGHAYFHCSRAILRAQLWKPETWPAPAKISFGRIMREQEQAADGDVERIDASVEDSYKVI